MRVLGIWYVEIFRMIGDFVIFEKCWMWFFEWDFFLKDMYLNEFFLSDIILKNIYVWI